MSKVAALVNYYNDLDMLMLQFEFGQFDRYDKVYIIDGPYSYATELEAFLEGPRKLSDTDFGKTIINSERVSYSYKEYADEREKRITAYESIEEDVIILHDTDEFYDDFNQSLNDFIKSDFAVASFQCQNLFLDGVYMANQFYSGTDVSNLPHKAFAFKKSKISGNTHLNYLWLVGVNQEEPDRSVLSRSPLTLGYHFTQVRTKLGQSQKFIFYSSLSRGNCGNEKGAIVSRISKDVTEGTIDKTTALSVYLHGIPAYLGISSLEKNLRLNCRIVGTNYLESIAQAAVQRRHKFQFGEHTMLPGYPFFAYIERGMFPFQINFENDVELTVTSYNYAFGKSTSKSGDLQGRYKSLTFRLPEEPELHGQLLEIRIKGSSISSPYICAMFEYLDD